MPYSTLADLKKQIPEKKIIELTNDAGAGPPKKIAYTSGGTYEIVAGDTIVQGSSHALVDEVVLSTGTWAAGTAAGDLYLSDQVGDFAAGNLAVGSHADAATVAGNSTDTVYAVDTDKVDEAIAKPFAELKAHCTSSGRPIPDLDLLVAAIARQHTMTVATLNARHFGGLPGVAVEDWGEPA